MIHKEIKQKLDERLKNKLNYVNQKLVFFISLPLSHLVTPRMYLVTSCVGSDPQV